MARRHALFAKAARGSLRVARGLVKVTAGGVLLVTWTPLFALMYLHMLGAMAKAKDDEGVPVPPPSSRGKGRR